MLGDKPGDNAQVEAVVDALGWACERKQVHWRPRWVVEKPRFEASLDHVDPASSAPLAPPWPDLILTIGRRPSMVALWIQEQSAGRTRLVLFGKPSGMMARFDLMVAGAEVQLPRCPNVVPIELPLMRLPAAAIEAARAQWEPRFAALPRPLIALLVGGPTLPFRFDRSVADHLIGLAAEIAKGGGTPYVTTSRRTPPDVVAALAAGLPPPARLFRWSTGAAENPYLGLLGLADGFVVTGDSVSMMAEVVRMRRPLAILDLPLGRWGAVDQVRRSLLRWAFAPTGGLLLRSLAGFLSGTGLLAPTRDFRAFHQMLLDRRLAVRAGEPLVPPTGPVPDDMPVVLRRIEALVGAT